MSPLLEIRELDLAIDGKTILKKIELNVNAGEFLSIVGPNGAGKTSLLRTIIRTLPPTRGNIFIEGAPLSTISQRNVARVIGYVPQSLDLIFPISVFDFVLMGRYSHFVSMRPVSKEDHQATEEALDRTEIRGLAGRAITSLSGGERQKALIAAALAQGPRILLLDEPTTFLDPRYEDDICRLLQQLKEQHGTTIIAVTHDLNMCALYSDRIVGMNNGSIQFVSSPKEFMQEERLERLFGKKFLFVQHPHALLPMIVPGSPQG